MRLLRRAVVPALLAAAPLAGSGQTSTAPVDDGLDYRFTDGIVAIAEDKIITVDDVRHEIEPLIPQIQRESHSQEEFDQKLEQLQDQEIDDLINKVLIIKEFRKDDKKHIPASYIDNQLADELSDQFDNDRSKFLAYLRARGQTLQDHRKEVEEDIIYHYMLQQQRKSADIVSPVRIEEYYKENKDQFYQEDSVHMRLIEILRAPGLSDSDLTAKAGEIVARLHAGLKFADLAKEFSEDSRRSKGGDWGWQKRTDLKPEFSDPLFALRKGEATDPILTPDGCFVLYAEDRKYAGIQPLSEVSTQIEHILSSEMARENMEHWLERLRRNGYVKHF